MAHEDNPFIYLIDITAYNPTISSTTTLRYTSGRGKTTTPSETPPNAYYEGRVLNPINFTRSAFSDSRVMGGAQVGYGEIVLSNLDQEMSFLLDYGLDGREVVVRTGYQDGAFPSDYTVFFTGTMMAPNISTTKVRLNLKDKLAILELPIQTNKFAGTNTAGSGKEGTADDIKDKPKPRLYGRCKEITPAYVNSTKYIYQINDGAIDAVESVKDSGTPLSFGTDRANLAAMEATAPAKGFYDTCLAEGLIRLNPPAAGKLTVTARGDKTGGVYVNKVADIVSRILTTCASVVVGDIDSSSFTALNAAASYEVGIYIDAESSIQEAIDQLLYSVGAWLAPNRLGKWAVGQLIAPSGTPLVVLTEHDILKLEIDASSDENKSIPIYKVILRYGKNWTQFSDSDLVGTVTSTRAAFINQWRETSATDTSVKTKHLLSTEFIKETLINLEASASTEAARILALHKVRRDYISVDVRLDENTSLIDIGSVIEVETDLLNYSAGRLFYVVGITTDGSRNKMTLQLWG